MEKSEFKTATLAVFNYYIPKQYTIVLYLFPGRATDRQPFPLPKAHFFLAFSI